jgi:hypothetical protein
LVGRRYVALCANVEQAALQDPPVGQPGAGLRPGLGRSVGFEQVIVSIGGADHLAQAGQQAALPIDECAVAVEGQDLDLRKIEAAERGHAGSMTTIARTIAA